MRTRPEMRPLDLMWYWDKLGFPADKPLTAATADKHRLYGLSVQDVNHDVPVIAEIAYRFLGREAVCLREDFCGTGQLSAAWVTYFDRKRDPSLHDIRTAVGVDLDPAPIEWHIKNISPRLTSGQRDRVSFVQQDVRASNFSTPFDIVHAGNYSLWVFKTRDEMRKYFKSVFNGLANNGVFIVDHYCGPDALRDSRMETEVEFRHYTAAGVETDDVGERCFSYQWDQRRYNPVDSSYLCHIHYSFLDGTELRCAFTYDWRYWSMIELLELLQEVGFETHVFVDTTDPDDPTKERVRKIDDLVIDGCELSIIVGVKRATSSNKTSDWSAYNV